MDIIRLAQTLHPLEMKVFPHLEKHSTVTALTQESGMQEIEVMRAVQWLQNKKIVTVVEENMEIVTLDENGLVYRKKGLPERNFLKQVHSEFMPVQRVAAAANVEKSELNICIGVLRKKAAIELSKNDTLQVRLTGAGKALLEKPSLEERFLKTLDSARNTAKLSPEEIFALDQLKHRKQIIKTDVIKIRTVTLTDLGRQLLTIKLDTNVIDRLTPGMLKTGSWKNKNFRRYDVEINVPTVNGGKRHFVNQATDVARQIWVSMGFKEMTGPIVQTSFWNFDALFTAQDHPVREMQDTFFVGSVKKGRLPENDIVSEIKKAHEEGVGGSTGWQYKWNPEHAKTNVARTHTTCLSSKTLTTLKKEDLPAKFFALGKCFRNETVDWSHAFEFNQTEGIVVDPNANFRHLLGYLKQFFATMGFPTARFRPAYFPYTEPSVEIDVFHPVRKEWLELGGAGIFRPEVTIPLLGKEIPVLAWGPGFDRIILEYYGINDIRELYKNDIKQLREMKAWMK